MAVQAPPQPSKQMLSTTTSLLHRPAAPGLCKADTLCMIRPERIQRHLVDQHLKCCALLPRLSSMALQMWQTPLPPAWGPGAQAASGCCAPAAVLNAMRKLHLQAHAWLHMPPGWLCLLESSTAEQHC
jgi:hypothetical protein